MWNDHAVAQRLLAIPGRDAIITSGGVGNIAGGTWSFPSNTVLARTLTLEMKVGDSASARHIETQRLHWDGQAWNPYSYRWRTNQADADLVANEGTNDTFTVVDPSAPGGLRKTPWRFMSRAECLRCHNAWAGDALTMNWLQLGNAADQGSELHRLASLGLITVEKPPGIIRALVNPHDDSALLTDRARSWLHVNCATCHRFGAGGNAAVRFNYDGSLSESRTIDARPVRGEFDLKDARIVAPGDPYRSTLYYRISTEGAGRMPHIGSRLVDLEGTQLIRDWIQELGGQKRGPNSFAQLSNPSPALATMNGALSLLDFLTTAGRKPMTNATEAAGYSRVRGETMVEASSHTNALVRDLFQHLLPADQRRQTLGAEIQPATILSLTGNRERGRELFAGASQCARCHVCETAGRAFGPTLTGIARKYNRAQLLDHILQPSKEIAPEYKTVAVTLADDTEVTGFVIQRLPSGLILRDETLTDHLLKFSSLKESRNSALSAMPEGLLAPLTAQETADLVEYLFQSR
jgi:putative heme-binding domain-containing protein